MLGCQERKEKYCCYNSALARIIHEQASITGQSTHPLGFDTTDGHQTFNQDCLGFTFTEFSQLDFDKLDLSEWMELLIGAGMLPGDTKESIDAFTDINVVTRSLARSQPDFDPNTSEVLNAADQAEDVVGVAGAGYDEYRQVEREQLIMNDQYQIDYEFCGYIHDKTKSYDGLQGYVIYADGSKNFVTHCTRDPNGAEYSHLISPGDCAPVVIDEEGNTAQPMMHIFTGKFGESVIGGSCVRY